MKKIFTLTLFLSFIFLKNAGAQCSAIMQDSLLPNYNLQLVAVPTSGIPPFTYTWTITGGISGNVTPIQSTASGDTILIASGDLFSNYGCVFITLCVHDSTGCTNCLSDTAFTTAITCYSAFTWQALQAGQAILFPPNPVPDFMGISVATWTENGNQQSAPVINGSVFMQYNPTTYNPAGYDVPVCIQTFFQNVNFFCIACDTVHINPVAPNSIDQPANKLRAHLQQNPVTDQLLVVLEDNQQPTWCELIDIHGKVVERSVSVDGRWSVNTSTLPTGIYIARISTATQSRHYKVVKQ